jgi:hypothetical protein
LSEPSREFVRASERESSGRDLFLTLELDFERFPDDLESVGSERLKDRLG